MAQISNPPRRVVGRLWHWIYPSHRQVALILVVDAGMTVLGLPLAVHVLAAATLHWLLAGGRW